MTLPPWLPVALWFGAVALGAAAWLVVDVKFRSAHQRRYGGYRSTPDRLEQFGRDPGQLLKDEPMEWRARFDSYFVKVDDADVERLRRLSLGLFVACVFLVFAGLFVSFILVAAARRILEGHALLVVPQIFIVAVWTIWLLRLVGRHDRSNAAMVILLVAVTISVGLLVLTLALTK